MEQWRISMAGGIRFGLSSGYIEGYCSFILLPGGSSRKSYKNLLMLFGQYTSVIFSDYGWAPEIYSFFTITPSPYTILSTSAFFPLNCKTNPLTGVRNGRNMLTRC